MALSPSLRRIAKAVSFRTTIVLAIVVAATVIHSDLTKDMPLAPEQPARAPNVVTRRIIEAYGRLPLSFEPNLGQADDHVKFLSRAAGFTLCLTPSEAVMSLADSHVIRVRLLGSKQYPTIRGSEGLRGRTNYFRGGDPTKWLTDVPNYRKVEYEEVYPGIDLVYYGNHGELEYDFVVAPGAHYNAIRMAVEGADDVAIDSAGNLALRSGDVDMRMLKPRVYQEGEHGRQEIEGKFRLRENKEICFNVAEYDTGRSLVIDPAVAYSYWTGDGTLESREAAIAVDTEGNAYITGATRYTTFPVVNALHSQLNGGDNLIQYDAFVAKVNASGTALVYSTYLGGYYDDVGADIAVDVAGCAYIAGATMSTPVNPQASDASSFPLKNPLAATYRAVSTKIFVTKLSAAGNALVYSTLLGGQGENDGDMEELSGRAKVFLAVDNSGSAFVAGKTDTSGGFPLVGAFQSKGEYFLSKINSSCTSLVYSTYVGTRAGESFKMGNVLLEGLGVDSFGNAYIAGSEYVDSTTQLFLQKINPSGSARVYTTLYGGSDVDFTEDLAVDSRGNSFMVARTHSKDFPTVNAYQATYRDSMDIVIAKFGPSGQVIYATYLGGTSWDTPCGIAVDRSGRAHVTGWTSSTDYPVVDAPQSSCPGGKFDAFVSCLDSTGSKLVYSTYLGGSDWDWGTAIAADPYGSSYTLGWSKSADFPTTVTKTSSRNMFIVKIGSGVLTERDTVEVWQQVQLVSPGSFKTTKDSNVVTFDGIKATITQANQDTLTVLIPPELVGDRRQIDVMPDTTNREVTLVARVLRGAGDTLDVLQRKCLFVPPRLLIHDEVTRSSPPVRQDIMLVPGPRWRRTYRFWGSTTDGTAAIRLLNTSQATPPLTLRGKVIAPDGELFDKNTGPTPGNLLNIGNCNAGIQFPISQEGWYIVVVEAAETGTPAPPPWSFGPLPALYQIHLAGNVGLPRKVGEPPRGIRLDTYFNHPAPRTETLVNNGLGRVAGEWAETGLFKFANPVSVSQYAIAVMISPAVAGFPIGTPPIRSRGPLVMGQLPNRLVDVTVPMATAPGTIHPVPGTVIDLAQVPIPASVVYLHSPDGVARILGKNDGAAVTLPITVAADTVISSLIVDMGSGNEIVNGSGSDFRVIALSGTYQVAVGNTPFDLTFKNVGSGTGQQDFDMTGTGLSSARYVRLDVSADSASFDAVEALHLFTDQIDPTVGPLADAGWATITMRHRKAPVTAIDPVLELIGPDGSALAKNDSDFGDDLEADKSDAGLIKIQLTQRGFHRFLGRGYDTQPDAKAFGTYYARLETAGDYDPAELAVSAQAETLASAQKNGSISLPRERDSYLFQASAGTKVNIVVKGTGTSSLADPLVELYDPEDFLIAACDNYEGRGKNAVISITLPTTGRTFPEPSTYRIVVMGLDTTTNTTTPLLNSVCHVRQANGGAYELKVFSGVLADEGLKAPAIAAITPNAAVRGAANVQAVITGTYFASGATVAFSGTGVTVDSVRFVGSSQLIVALDVASDATLGYRDVTVTNPGGLGDLASGVFQVRTTLGTVALNWSAPSSGQSMNPPGGLTATFNPSGGTGLVSGHTPGTKGERAQPEMIGKLRSSLGKTQSIAEVEPNNGPSQAQALTGDTLVEVSGQAEVRDVGSILYGGDDIEDLFKVTIASPGLYVLLSGFDSDCDLYLLDPSISGILASSLTTAAGGFEFIEGDELPAGTYLIGVSIYDAAPLGADSTVYHLEVEGNFGGSTVLTLQSYSIYRSTTSNAKISGTRIGSVAVGTTSFLDQVPYTGTFYYQVTAVYNHGESGPSNEVSRTVTEVNEQQGPGLPVSFALLQNYPNPFNPKTVVRCQVPVATSVRLVVYDMLGREVAMLMDERKEPGSYNAEFDGSGLSSGVYFYRMTAGDFVSTKRMLLIR